MASVQFSHPSILSAGFPPLDRDFSVQVASKRAGKKAQAAHSSREKSSHDIASGNRVLLLGRFQELALYRAEVLRDRGFEVRTSTSRDEALRLIHRQDFDVAVLSYTLSSEMVEELAEEIREHCPRCPLVVIAQTAIADRKIAPDAIALADQGPKALLAALKRVLRKH